MDVGKSEGCIGATISGNGRQPDPGEQRRPVLIRTSEGKHGWRKDVGEHVTGTEEGS